MTVEGSPDALGELLAGYEGRLRRFVRASVHNGADAEDCLQEIRLRVTRSIASFRNEAPFAPWLMTIAANVVRNALTRTRRHPPLVEEVADPAPGAVHRLIREEEIRAARSAIRDLPDRHREVILFRLQQGLPHREVALALGISEAAARVLFCRALRTLRNAVGGRHAPS